MARTGQKAAGGWSPAAEDRFFEVLAASCNVTLACKEAKVSSAGVYRRRRKEATFRSRWGEALATGYRVRSAAGSGPYRELREVELVEVSLVADPMQPRARVHAVDHHVDQR